MRLEGISHTSLVLLESCTIDSEKCRSQYGTVTTKGCIIVNVDSYKNRHTNSCNNNSMKYNF